VRLVLDASAAVRLVMRAELAEQLLAHIAAAAAVIAPSLYASEVANALWKYVQAGTLGIEAALDRYAEAINLIDDFTPDLELTTEALAEAVRYGHPVYDLLYAILARRTGCGILTLDRRLATLLGHIGIPSIQV
jgi:predicted nucleic acid-binding protein